MTLQENTEERHHGVPRVSSEHGAVRGDFSEKGRLRRVKVGHGLYRKDEGRTLGGQRPEDLTLPGGRGSLGVHVVSMCVSACGCACVRVGDCVSACVCRSIMRSQVARQPVPDL